jgi:hypothetical protein
MFILEPAIQYGEKTVKYPRYHHPEVILQDMLEQAKANIELCTSNGTLSILLHPPSSSPIKGEESFLEN